LEASRLSRMFILKSVRAKLRPDGEKRGGKVHGDKRGYPHAGGEWRPMTSAIIRNKRGRIEVKLIHHPVRDDGKKYI
jgi:hypothetical protein